MSTISAGRPQAVVDARLSLYQERVRALTLQLAALDPMTVLARGFSHCTHLETGATVGSIVGIVAPATRSGCAWPMAAFATVVSGNPTRNEWGRHAWITTWDGESRADDPSVADLTFEEAFGALEATVDALSRGGLAIEELVAFYERGIGLARVCNEHARYRRASRA